MRAAAAVILCAAGAGAIRDAVLRDTIAQEAPVEELMVLMYDSAQEAMDQSAPLEQQLRNGGWRYKKIGQGGGWAGFGTKVRGTMKALADLQPSALVVVTDAYDVLLNPIPRASQAVAAKVAAAVANRPGTVIVGAESQCCVNALSRAPPGALIAANGTRTGRACSSRGAGCTWRPGGEAPWVAFMADLARARAPRSAGANPFLNAGLVAGRAGDLLAMYSALKVADDEDDQALMTEFLFRHPDRVTLDYDQELFGNNRWRKGSEEGCMFDKEDGHLVHRETGTTPAFLHTSGQFWGCYRQIAEAAGVELSDEMHSRKAQSLANGYTNGDPFTAFEGKRTQFYLPVGKETKLIKCGDVTVHGSTMPSGIPGDSQQWFNKIRVLDNGTEVVSVEARVLKAAVLNTTAANSDDVTVNTGTRVNDVLRQLRVVADRIDEGPQKLTTLDVNASGTPLTETAAVSQHVTVLRDTAVPIGDGFSERVNVTLKDFGVEVLSAVANKFRTAAEQVSKLHLDIAFTQIDAHVCTGLLPEMWGIRPMTADTVKLLTPPQMEEVPQV